MLNVIKVSQVAPSVIKVTFDAPPLASTATGATDALNVSNYLLNGSGTVLIQKVQNTNDYSVEILLQSPLTLGQWRLQVVNVTDVNGNAITTNSTEFQAVYNLSTTQIANTNQVLNDSVRTILRKYLNPAFQGTNWEGVIDAFAAGLSKVIQNVEDAAEQLHIVSASGQYLDQFGKDYDFPRPFELGLSEEDYRNLLIEVTNDKLTLDSLNRVINIFYGDYSTRASADAIQGVYVLEDGDDLDILFDESRFVKVYFRSENFRDISRATAQEVADSINTAIVDNGFKDFAESHYDGYVHTTYVRLYSASIGLSGSVRILGGKAQNIVTFLTKLDVTYIAGTTWTMEKFPVASEPNYLRMTPDSVVDFSPLLPGDYVNIFDTEFFEVNRGSFTIAYVGPTYIELDHVNGVDQNVFLTPPNTITFYRPTKQNIVGLDKPAFATQVSPSGAQAVLPATSRNVPRNLSNATYFNEFESQGIDVANIFSLPEGNLLSITTADDHNLSDGDEIYVELPCQNSDGIFNVTVFSSTVIRFYLLNSTGSFDYKQLFQSTPYTQGDFVKQYDHVWLCIQSGITGAFTLDLDTTPGSVTQYATCKFLYWEPNTNPNIVKMNAIEGTFTSNYIFNPVDGLTITKNYSTITQALNKNTTYRTITIASSSNFPNEEGYVIFALGQDNQVGPVHYIATPSTTTILLDSGFVFPEDLAVGTDITLLKSKTPYNPDPLDVVGISYITGSHLGRVFCQNTLDFNKAEGIDLEFRIIYPSTEGLANYQYPYTGTKVNDAVYVWGDDEQKELDKANDF